MVMAWFEGNKFRKVKFGAKLHGFSDKAAKALSKYGTFRKIDFTRDKNDDIWIVLVTHDAGKSRNDPRSLALQPMFKVHRVADPEFSQSENSLKDNVALNTNRIAKNVSM